MPVSADQEENSKPSDDLVCFLYVLTRDHLTSGVVEKILLDHIHKGKGQRVKYSCPHIEALARSWADELTT